MGGPELTRSEFAGDYSKKTIENGIIGRSQKDTNEALNGQLSVLCLVTIYYYLNYILNLSVICINWANIFFKN